MHYSLLATGFAFSVALALPATLPIKSSDHDFVAAPLDAPPSLHRPGNHNQAREVPQHAGPGPEHGVGHTGSFPSHPQYAHGNEHGKRVPSSHKDVSFESGGSPFDWAPSHHKHAGRDPHKTTESEGSPFDLTPSHHHHGSRDAHKTSDSDGSPFDWTPHHKHGSRDPAAHETSESEGSPFDWTPSHHKHGSRDTAAHEHANPKTSDSPINGFPTHHRHNETRTAPFEGVPTHHQHSGRAPSPDEHPDFGAERAFDAFQTHHKHNGRDFPMAHKNTGAGSDGSSFNPMAAHQTEPHQPNPHHN